MDQNAVIPSYNYLQNFLDAVRILPTDLQRSMYLLRLLDQKFQDTCDVSNGLETACFALLEGQKSDTATPTLDQLNTIRDTQLQASYFIEEKLQIANQTFNLMHDFIERLNSDIEKFAIELGPDVPTEDFDAESVLAPKKQSHLKKRFSTRRMSRGNLSDYDDCDTAMDDLETAQEEEELFCLCRQPSWGEMVCCDDPDCDIQWFHFACVSLTQEPRGTWFCPNCRPRHRSIRL